MDGGGGAGDGEVIGGEEVDAETVFTLFFFLKRS